MGFGPSPGAAPFRVSLRRRDIARGRAHGPGRLPRPGRGVRVRTRARHQRPGGPADLGPRRPAGPGRDRLAERRPGHGDLRLAGEEHRRERRRAGRAAQPPALPAPALAADQRRASRGPAGYRPDSRAPAAAGVEHRWLETAAAFCRDAIEQLDQTHPYEAEAAIAFLDGTPDRAWADQQARRLGELVRGQRIVLLDPDHPEQSRLAPGYAEGEYHLPHDYARRQAVSLAAGSPAPRSTAACTISPVTSRTTAAGRSAGRHGPRPQSWKPGPG